MFYPRVLNNNQKKILACLDFFSQDIYLAGGTGLALQLGHRTSVDFDFYSLKSFGAEEILFELQKKFKNLVVRQAIKDTLILTALKTDISLFYYPYKLIKPPLNYGKIKIASPQDIAAMKVISIVQRGKRRDFVDIFYLLGQYSLKEVIGFTLKKYPGFQEGIILKALIYFEDAEEEELERGIKILDKNFSWKKAKEKIFSEVRRYQLAMIKK